MTPSIEVFYFGARGRAELTRLIFEFAGVSYENKTPKNWAEEKKQTPFGQLPVLIWKENNKEYKIAQSMAMARFAAKKYGFYPEDPFNVAIMESYTDTVCDFIEKFAKLVYATPKDKVEEAKAEFKKIEIPSFIEMFSPILKNAGSNGFFFNNNKPTLAEFMIFNFMNSVNSYASDCFAETNAPELWKTYKFFNEHPKFLEYSKSERRFAH